MVLLRSVRAVRRSGDEGETRPQVKKEWMDDSAAEVMGAVDVGDRMRARNGDKIVVRGMSRRSVTATSV
jgi:hypothetical protein